MLDTRRQAQWPFYVIMQRALLVSFQFSESVNWLLTRKSVLLGLPRVSPHPVTLL